MYQITIFLRKLSTNCMIVSYLELGSYSPAHHVTASILCRACFVCFLCVRAVTSHTLSLIIIAQVPWCCLTSFGLVSSFSFVHFQHNLMHPSADTLISLTHKPHDLSYHVV